MSRNLAQLDNLTEAIERINIAESLLARDGVRVTSSLYIIANALRRQLDYDEQLGFFRERVFDAYMHLRLAIKLGINQNTLISSEQHISDL